MTDAPVERRHRELAFVVIFGCIPNPINSHDLTWLEGLRTGSAHLDRCARALANIEAEAHARDAERIRELERELAEARGSLVTQNLGSANTIGTLSWTREQMRLRGHTCINAGGSGEFCSACENGL